MVVSAKAIVPLGRHSNLAVPLAERVTVLYETGLTLCALRIPVALG